MTKAKIGRGAAGRSQWTGRKHRAVEIIAHRGDAASLEQIAGEVGVHPRTLRRWYADPAFQEAVLERARRDICTCLPAAKNVLIRKAIEDGDKECLKLIFRIAGLIDEPVAAPPQDPRHELALLSDEELLARARALNDLTA